MSKNMNRKTALITGATSGIGAAFAKKLASQNYDLILTGRREKEIQIFAEKLREKYSTSVEVIIAELSDDNAINSLVEKIKTMSNLEMLVNNAGFLKKNRALNEEDISSHEAMLKVHAISIIKLTYAALPNMIANKKGFVINVSSILGFFPFYKQPIYTATKAFVAMFTESLNLELKGTGVKAQALCPGLTYSDIHARIGIGVKRLSKKKIWLWKSPMLPEVVVEKSLGHLQKSKSICIPGFTNKVITFLYAMKRFF
jgi:hypothetical protein